MQETLILTPIAMAPRASLARPVTLSLVAATMLLSTVSNAAQPQCSPSERWNPDMQMCMPNGKAVPGTAASGSPPDQGSATAPDAGTAAMPAPPIASRQSTSSAGMDMADGGKPKSASMLQINQFAVYSHTTGPRGQSRLTGPGSWMLMYDHDLTPRNHLSVSIMASPEQLTVGDKGTPQLLQTENIDNMHAHDTLMALEFRDVIALGSGGDQQLIFLFAPRGAAAIGPVPFMHRQSAEGNPDAPLGHGSEDGFHDASTVIGIEYHFARTTIEATAFSGEGVRWPLPLHSPDSFAFRFTQDIDDHLKVGASYGDVLSPDDAGVEKHSQFISAWLATSHQLGRGTLRSSLVWARGRDGNSVSQTSLLAEAVYQRGPNALFGRAEILQITPEQLDVATIGSTADPRWVKALTLGYERTLLEQSGLSSRVGGSYTKDFIPSTFKPEYGSDPGGFKLFLRIKFATSDGHVM
jgi:hypothetical protein